MISLYLINKRVRLTKKFQNSKHFLQSVLSVKFLKLLAIKVIRQRKCLGFTLVRTVKFGTFSITPRRLRLDESLEATQIYFINKYRCSYSRVNKSDK